MNVRDVKSKISTSWSAESRPSRRNRSISMVTSSPLATEEQPWIREDVSPVAKQPRQQEPSRFSRSSSARFSRRLSFSSESEDLQCRAPRCAHIGGGDSEGCSTASSIPDFDFDTLEEKMSITLSPLISFDKKSEMAAIIVDEDEPLTLFNQTPRAETPPRRNTPRSRIPVPTTRSKSLERKSNTVSNIPTLKHSKSGEVQRKNLVSTPQRKLSTPVITLKQSVKQTERELQKCLVKTPRSLLSNPTSATTRKVLRSKSTDNLQKHAVVNSTEPINTSLQPDRLRRKSTDASALHKVSFKSTGMKTKKGLTKSKSSEISRHNVVSLRRDEEAVMKPDLQNVNSSKSSGRSFVDWLKKRRNES